MIQLKTASGKTIPSIGLGTYPFQGRVMTDMVKSAVRVGYRLFDTSDDYYGEKGIGVAIKELEKEHICGREDLFIQTKISSNAAYMDEPLIGVYFNKQSPFMQRHTVEELVREKVSTSLRDLGTDYIDSLLIHLPYPDYIEEIWDCMTMLKDEGIVRYIGVSNFHKRHIESIARNGIYPSFNEIYISPIGIKKEDVSYNQSHDILIMTYSPLMDLSHNMIPLDTIQPLMNKYNKSAAQIILRWNIDRGCLPLPKTRNKSRLEENFNIFDFSLTKEEIDVVSSVNRDYQYLVESKICPGL